MKTLYKNSLLLIILLLTSKSNEKLKTKHKTNTFLQVDKDQQKTQQQKTQQQIQREEEIIESIKDTSNIYYAKGKCEISNCDNCVSKNICQCPYGYAHDPKKKVTNTEKSCQYKLKKQTIFFLLELLFPFGPGHFYAGRTIYGIVKISVFAGIILLDIIIKRILKTFESKQRFNIVSYILYFAYIAWILVDLICIGINHWKDGKGFEVLTMREEI